MRAVLAALLLLTVAGPAHWPSGIESAGTGVAIALPLIAGGISLYKDDRTGLAELTVDTLATVGTAYALKNIVREQRPGQKRLPVLSLRHLGAGLRAGAISVGPLWLAIWPARLCRRQLCRLQPHRCQEASLV